MNESLAIWCDNVHDGGLFPAKIELHFNLWSDMPHSADILEIGVLYDTEDRFDVIRICFPDRINLAAIQDSGARMEDQTSLCAVFNELLDMRAVNERVFDALDLEGNLKYRVIKMNKVEDLSFQDFDKGPTSGRATIISFSRMSYKKTETLGVKNYIRFRLILKKSLREAFCRRVSARDGFLSTLLLSTDAV